MNTATRDERFAPPQSHVEDVDLEGTTILASRSSRLGAAIIDAIVVMALMWLVSMTTPWNPWAHSEGDFWWSFQTGDALGGFVALIFAQGYLLATRAQTVGKLALGLRIVRADGSPASFGRLLGLRDGFGSLVNIVPALGLIYYFVDVLMIFHSSRRCLHDRIADTIVIKT